MRFTTKYFFKLHSYLEILNYTAFCISIINIISTKYPYKNGKYPHSKQTPFSTLIMRSSHMPQFAPFCLN